MVNRASFIRSAARATFSAYRRLPIRWRLAGGSALLTLVILLGFAVAVGTLTSARIRSNFDDGVRLGASELQARLRFGFDPASGRAGCISPDLDTYASAEGAAIRLVSSNGLVLCRTRNAPDLGPPGAGLAEHNGYRVESRPGPALLGEPTVIQYGRKLDDVHRTVRRVWALLAFGVLGGCALALLAGLALARRAMRPIAQLTKAAREIERTRDPSRRVPQPDASDEVAELAHTLEGMLQALDAARAEREETLQRQREFVADASHELRTPLTSVLSNLELLADQLEGEQGEVAGSALRSSRRMRRLVGDLLLLARADAGRVVPHEPTDVAEVLVEAAAEIEPVAADHELTVSAVPAVVEGARDELHRLVLNLIENAIRHTPAGTQVRAAVQARNGEVLLTVEDDGPGIPPELAARVFERFVRGRGEQAGSSGLGLAIVHAVAQSHGGSVSIERAASGSGARFTVRLPAAGQAQR